MQQIFPNDLITDIKFPMLKILFKYIPIKTLLSIITRSKTYQKCFSLDISSYLIFNHFSQKKYNLLNLKTFSEVFKKACYKLQNDYTISQIAMGCGLYLLHLMNVNNIKRIPVYLNKPDLFCCYLQIAHNFSYSFNIIIDIFNDNMIEYSKQTEEFICQYLYLFDVLTLKNLQHLQFQLKYTSTIKVENFLKIIQVKIYKICFLHWKFTSKENQLFSIINKQCHEIVKCDLSHNTISNQSFDIITKMNLNQDLKSLHFKSSKLYKLNIDSLCSVFVYKHLLSLNLSNNKIGDEGLFHLAHGHFALLEKLVLSNNKITKKGIHYFAHSNLINLQYLNFEANDLSDSAVDFFKSPFTKLTFLNVTDCNLKDTDFIPLKQVSCIRLLKLFIGKNPFLNINSFQFILEKIPSLEYLVFSHTHITSEDISKIDKITNTSLRNLIISQNKYITSHGVINLLTKTNFQNLILLDLFNDDIDDTLIDYIIKEKVNKIQYINIDLNNLITADRKQECYTYFKKFSKVK